MPPPGYTRTPTGRSWAAMLARCENTHHQAYRNYGGRGIRVCGRWHSFDAFEADMGQRPEGMSIDRINNNGNYELGNCRWATTVQQHNNERRNRVIEYNGERLTLTQWARRVGIGFDTLRRRIERGLPPEEAFRMTVRPQPRRGCSCGRCRTCYRREWDRKKRQQDTDKEDT